MFTITTLKYIARVEGISFLIILMITMPLKYIFNIPEPNKVIGMSHGILFIAYIIWVVMLKTDLKLNNKAFFLSLLASIIPFGTFWAEKKYFHKST